MTSVSVEETHVLVEEDEDNLLILISATAVVGGTVVSLNGVAQSLLDINTAPVTPADIGAIPATEKAANSGVATLDSGGDVPLTQLSHARSTVTNTQTGNYTLVLADEGKVIEANSASPITVTVPPAASVAFPVGTIVDVCRIGSGTVTIAPGVGVTIPNRLEAAGTTSRTITSRYSVVTLRKRATNEWILSGEVT